MHTTILCSVLAVQISILNIYSFEICWKCSHYSGKKPATPAVSEDCKNFKRDLNSTRWNTEGSASDYFPVYF